MSTVARVVGGTMVGALLSAGGGVIARVVADEESEASRVDNLCP